MKTLRKLILGALICTSPYLLVAQDTKSKDTVKTVQESDRNVMLNAANNTGPRDVNIGLPATVGGTTVLENGLPVVYFFYPELPTKAWRQDAAIISGKLLDMGQTATNVGEVGYSLSTYDNLGMPKFMGMGTINSNHFGLFKSDISLSGPINKKGLKFMASAYLNLDPGTFDAEGMSKYYSDKTQLYKFALTQDYKFSGLNGSVSALYKYIQTDGLKTSFAPYIYDKGGKVKEYNGFKIGNDSYYENSGKVVVFDAFEERFIEKDIVKDYGTESHTFDLISKNKLKNGLNLDLIARYRHSEVGQYASVMTNVSKAGSNFTYLDGTAYSGEYAQSVMALATPKNPTQTFLATMEIGKKSGKHQWKAGLSEWHYYEDRYATETAFYTQEVGPNPKILVPKGANMNNFRNGMTAQNAYMEYHDGAQNKLALYMTDNWDLSKVISLNMGIRLEYQTLRGNYIELKNRTNNLNGPKTKVEQSWLNKTAVVGGVYKITQGFGVLANLMYTEQGGHMGNYNLGIDPDIKQSKIPSLTGGLFYNHKVFSLVSKITYITRDQYRGNNNFTHPTSGLPSRALVKYDIQTLGWTTDVVAKLFKGFDLHFLTTFQTPKYKNYDGTIKFGDGSTMNYDFEGKYVTGISKFLLEIDPSYTYKKFKVWGSARYFSKQYANLSNSLTFEGRWETFAGANYNLNKHLSFNLTVVNLLNQRGASGTISGTDLMSDEDARKKEGTVMSGTYIRPFTIEGGLRFMF